MHKNEHLIGGILFLIVGVIFGGIALSYPIGNSSAIGPGMLPIIVSISLILCSIGLVAQSLRDRPRMTVNIAQAKQAVKVVAVMLASVIWFGLSIERFGIPIAILGLVLICTLAGERRTFLSALGLALLLSIIITAIFAGLLGIPLKLVP